MRSNADIARRGFEAVARGDLDAVAELLDPDVKWHGGAPGPGSCHNRDEALEFIRRARAAGRMGQLEDVVDAGDRVVVVMRPPSGDLRANVTTFRDGKVVEMQAYERVAAALEAVGIAPST
jgi:ketosteroid isomerase-like protein